MAVEAELKVGRGGGRGGHLRSPSQRQENCGSSFTYYLSQEETRNRCLDLHNKFYPSEELFCTPNLSCKEIKIPLAICETLSLMPSLNYYTIHI